MKTVCDIEPTLDICLLAYLLTYLLTWKLYVTHQYCVEIVGVTVRIWLVNGKCDAVGKDGGQYQILKRSVDDRVKECTFNTRCHMNNALWAIQSLTRAYRYDTAITSFPQRQWLITVRLGMLRSLCGPLIALHFVCLSVCLSVPVSSGLVTGEWSERVEFKRPTRYIIDYFEATSFHAAECTDTDK